VWRVIAEIFTIVLTFAIPSGAKELYFSALAIFSERALWFSDLRPEF
jgi:hypothetical protein